MSNARCSQCDSRNDSRENRFPKSRLRQQTKDEQFGLAVGQVLRGNIDLTVEYSRRTESGDIADAVAGHVSVAVIQLLAEVGGVKGAEDSVTSPNVLRHPDNSVSRSVRGNHG